MSFLRSIMRASHGASVHDLGYGAMDEQRTILSGLLVEFEDEDQLLAAAPRVRDAGYRRWDCYSPYPVHGIDKAMGTPPTRLPIIIFFCGLVGALLGIGLTWWTNAANPEAFKNVPTFLQGYDFLISGKPIWSLPANIPVIFELTILFSAFGAVFGMLGLNGLPSFRTPLLRSHRIRRATADRFFIAIDAADPKFRESEALRFCESLGGTAIERIEDTAEKPRLPKWVVPAMVVMTCFALIPPALAWRSWFAKSDKPRFQIIQDMDNQEKFKKQQAHPLFADGRADRPRVANAIARQDVQALGKNPHFFDGRVNGEFATTFPTTDGIGKPFEVTYELLERGKQRYGIYCAPCHGLSGRGDGMVSRHAQVLVELGTSNTQWVAPTSVYDPTVTARSVGHLFNTITQGIRTMPAYGDQIPPADRWALVAYIRALERSQNATTADLTPEQRQMLEQRK